MTIEDVQVVITRETTPVTQAGFGLPLIVGAKGTTTYDTLGYCICNTLADVAALEPAEEDDPGTAGTEVYKIAQKIFAQTPAPEKIAVVWLDMTSPEALTTALTALMAAGHNDWYFLLSESQKPADVDALAAFAAANGKIYFGSMTNTVLGTLDDATLALDRAVILCHKNAATQYPAEAWVGRCAPELPGSITWKFKTLSGVSVSGYTPTEIDAIKEKHGNVIISQGGILHTTEGTVLSGEFIDVIRSQDWVKARIAEGVFRLLATSPKVAYDDRGIAMVLAEVQGVMQQATAQGIIARDADGNGMWSVTAPKRSEIAANNIANRVLPDVEFEFTLAGAIHSVTVRGVISV